MAAFSLRLFGVFFLAIAVVINTSFGLDVGPNIPISPDLRDILKKIDKQAILRPVSLEYSIFQGRSSLRDLSEQDLRLFDYNELSKTAVAALLLLLGSPDASHEVILGVTPRNMEAAEYAATHPGSGWLSEHPLDSMDDYLHSLLHCKEGSLIGEGNHTGYENAKYWAAGGPKQLETPDIPIHYQQALCRTAQMNAPLCVDDGVIAPETKQYSIIADGGKRRTVHVKRGNWDPFCWIDLQSQHCSGQLKRQAKYLQEWEIQLLLRYELLQTRGFPYDGMALLSENVRDK